jgi:hypothetical protein
MRSYLAPLFAFLLVTSSLAEDSTQQVFVGTSGTHSNSEFEERNGRVYGPGGTSFDRRGDKIYDNTGGTWDVHGDTAYGPGGHKCKTTADKTYCD